MTKKKGKKITRKEFLKNVVKIMVGGVVIFTGINNLPMVSASNQKFRRDDGTLVDFDSVLDKDATEIIPGFYTFSNANHQVDGILTVGTGSAGNSQDKYYSDSTLKAVQGWDYTNGKFALAPSVLGTNNIWEWDPTNGFLMSPLASDKYAIWGATPIIQPSGTGETVGFTAGTGTGVNDDSTFTGNVGSKAYRINDIVKALKNLGGLEQ